MAMVMIRWSLDPLVQNPRNQVTRAKHVPIRGCDEGKISYAAEFKWEGYNFGINIKAFPLWMRLL